MDSWDGTRAFTVKAIHPESEIIKSFYLAPTDGAPIPDYKPGQFLGFEFDIPGAASPVVRTYTVSDSGPKDGCYRISVKREPEGTASKFLHDQIAVGSEINVRAPGGDFYLTDGDAPLVLLAGGVGITPLLAMVNHLTEQNSDRPVYLFHAVLNGHVQAFASHLADLDRDFANVTLKVAMDAPAETDSPDITGRLSIDVLKKHMPAGTLDQAAVFMCGPVPFMKALYQGLRDAGLARDQINYEFFGDGELFEAPSATEAPAVAGDGPSVVFQSSGKTLVWDDRHDTLLALAEANDIMPPFSCRSGFCHTCKVSLLSGEIEYTESGIIEPEADEVLLCCAIPKDDVTVDA